jgi:crotonobetainyl-CoA:carnitine CoA-transferase CaiB-like acyl-CoA transferase
VLADAEIPGGPINTFEDLRHDPHLNEIDFFRAFEHPSEGRLEVLDTGLRFDREPLSIRRHQPRLGEHTHKILSEAGLSSEEIAAAME